MQIDMGMLMQSSDTNVQYMEELLCAVKHEYNYEAQTLLWFQDSSSSHVHSSTESSSLNP